MELQLRLLMPRDEIYLQSRDAGKEIARHVQKPNLLNILPTEYIAFYSDNNTYNLGTKACQEIFLSDDSDI